jgi:hypothetical protein
MKIYWTFKQIPELRDLSKDQQKRVWQACYVRNWKVQVISFLVNVTVVFAWQWLYINSGRTHPTVGFLFMGLSLFLVNSVLWLVQMGSLRPSFRQYLNEHEHI